MSDCPRLNKWVRGCSFEARYDYSAINPNVEFKGSSVGLDKVLDAYRAKTYVKDVCTTCGKAVRREASA